MTILIGIAETILILVLFHFIVPVIINSTTGNSWIKLPLFLIMGVLAGCFMVWLSYVPYFLIFIWIALQKTALDQIKSPEFSMKVGFIPNKKLFYISSYSYIIVACITAYFFQIEVQPVADGQFIPLWKALLSNFI
ncbi:hypothetical protein [Maridesulfovibrio bastinii]|uniref:hypothetical protein n=1 Tax=Maridesulfovibrio bastinii TaxID=47157 RepID=UPI000485245C|nr:hypothetical protein [Maridesulfovibrio bastinii]